MQQLSRVCGTKPDLSGAARERGRAFAAPRSKAAAARDTADTTLSEGLNGQTRPTSVPTYRSRSTLQDVSLYPVGDEGRWRAIVPLGERHGSRRADGSGGRALRRLGRMRPALTCQNRPSELCKPATPRATWATRSRTIELLIEPHERWNAGF